MSADRYVFADEAGNFDFSTKRGASRFFVLCTVTSDSCAVGDALLAFRRDLGWKGRHLNHVFHAAYDPPTIRDDVFALLDEHDFRVDATIFEKRKTRHYLQENVAFYKVAWYLHFKFVAPQVARDAHRMLVVASSLGTKREHAALHAAVDNVVGQVAPCSHRVAFWPANSDPCLQVADYCTWAIQRKWEAEDDHSHALIADKIRSEYEVWRHGETFYY